VGAALVGRRAEHLEGAALQLDRHVLLVDEEKPVASPVVEEILAADELLLRGWRREGVLLGELGQVVDRELVHAPLVSLAWFALARSISRSATASARSKSMTLLSSTKTKRRRASRR